MIAGDVWQVSALAQGIGSMAPEGVGAETRWVAGINLAGSVAICNAGFAVAKKAMDSWLGHPSANPSGFWVSLRKEMLPGKTGTHVLGAVAEEDDDAEQMEAGAGKARRNSFSGTSALAS